MKETRNSGVQKLGSLQIMLRIWNGKRRAVAVEDTNNAVPN